MSQQDYKRAVWLTTTSIYEVNLRQYTPEGTFDAFGKELPRLKDMGVEVLWFMPIHPIGEINRKGILGSYYSVKDFKGINPEYGRPRDFKALVETAHKYGMKVIIDWVANHAAWDNVWTKDHPDYFVRDSNGNFMAPYDWTDVIQIDHTSELEQAAMIEAMKFWITDFDIDGFRADLAHLTPLPFWKKARTEIDKLKPGLFWLAETEEVAYHEVFDASYTWEWMHQTEEFSKGKTGLKGLYGVLNKYENSFPASAYRMYFTSNHDENSWNGTEYEKYGEMARVFAVFSFTWNSIPMIYSGQELPNRKRLKFFEKDTINWTGRYELHEFYKTLLKLRKRNPALRTGDPEVTTHHIETSEKESIVAYLRKNNSSEVFVILNLNNKKTSVELTDHRINGDYIDIFSEKPVHFATSSVVEMESGGYLVFEKNIKNERGS